MTTVIPHTSRGERHLLANDYDPSYRNKGGSPSMGVKDFSRLKSTYDILQGVIQNADAYTLGLLAQATDEDLNQVFDDIVQEVNNVLYGASKDSKIEPTLAYIKEVDAVLKDEMRKADLTFFCTDVMGMDINWHHVEWGWLVQHFPLIAIIAARDHGKSYYFSNAYPLWMAYKYDKYAAARDRLNGRLGYLFSNTLPQAADLLEILKDNVEGNDLLREKLYPDYREEWSKTRIKFKNGCRLRVKGFLSSVRGAHPGYIVCDDPLKDNVLYSPIQRERTKSYFKAVIMNMLIPGGQLIVVGTPFHYEDLYVVFRESIDFAFREYPGVDAKGRVLWDKRHSREDLAMKKRNQGSIIYSREILCKPISEESSLFPEKSLQTALLGMSGYSYVRNIEEHKVKFKKVVTGCDFAISANVGADYTAFVTFGIDERDVMWLLNVYHRKGVGFSEQKRALRAIWRNFRPNLMLLEANQFQRIYTEVLKDESDMPVKPFTTTGKTKHHLETGVPGLVIVFENGKFRFPYAPDSKAVTDMVLEEFRAIGWTEKGIQGVGQHDDIVMAIWLARMAALGDAKDFIFDFVGEESMAA